MRYPVFACICPNHIWGIKIKDLLLWLLYSLIKIQIIPDSNKLTWYQINLPYWQISHQIVFNSELWWSQNFKVLGLWMHSFNYSLIHVFSKHIQTFMFYAQRCGHWTWVQKRGFKSLVLSLRKLKAEGRKDPTVSWEEPQARQEHGLPLAHTFQMDHHHHHYKKGKNRKSHISSVDGIRPNVIEGRWEVIKRKRSLSGVESPNTA